MSISGQEQQVLTLQVVNSMMESEKQGKVQRFRYLNPYVKKGQIVFAGSSLMEQFPIHEFLQDFDLPYIIYNRGIGGYTTAEMLKVMDVCIYDLAPRAIFLNIGTNDLNGPGYTQEGLMERLEEILKGIRSHLPDAKLYLLAYYPINPEVETSPFIKEVFRYRTNERIRAANEGVQSLAKAYNATYLDLNKNIQDANGNLKAEFTVEGMHMYANGYKAVLDQLLPILQELA